MAIVSSLSLFFLALSALYDRSVAVNSGVGKRQALADQLAGLCHEQSWIPACPGMFACVPPGAICCSDGMSYAMPLETCTEGGSPMATAGAGAGPGSGSGNYNSPSHDAAAATVTAQPHHGPGADAPSVDFLGFGSNWYTFAMTFHFLSHWYSLVDHTSTVLVSSEITSCTTVSVSATDEAHASEVFKSYTATAELASPTETYISPSSFAVDSADPVASFLTTGSPTGVWETRNETAGTATMVPRPVVTAGAVRLGGFGVAAAGMGTLVLGAAAVLM